jgi:hypothetical protein
MVHYAIKRLHESDDNSPSVGCLNVLLADRSAEGRAALDTYLAPLEMAKSWKSHDVDALAIRLSQGEAPAGLWRAGERMMRHTRLSGDWLVEVILKHDQRRAIDVLLERAFAPPDILVSAQPDAIQVLSTVDKPLATQAFVQSWRNHLERRQHLATCARYLDDPAVEAMIASLSEEYGDGHMTATYRTICVELRHEHERARPILIARFDGASGTERAALCAALGWVAPSAEWLGDLLERESDRQARRELDEVARRWRHVEAAVERFRAERTLETMEYAIDFVDPAPLIAWGDRLRIIEPISEHPRLTGFAERQLARRLNEVTGSRVKRVIIRK